ncbi:unnamed protein product [Polarella glacialis]|uniref:Uncharacterized protein n=1 Tax=Polarella glacialis TaxID=89957 RepID=A0A813LUP2_POLGL|nr:unnamed protein product [Polarella glacialis]
MDGAASDPCDKCFGIGFDRARLVMSGWLRGFSANSFLQTERGQPVLFAALDLFALRQPVLFVVFRCSSRLLPLPSFAKCARWAPLHLDALLALDTALHSSELWEKESGN